MNRPTDEAIARAFSQLVDDPEWGDSRSWADSFRRINELAKGYDAQPAVDILPRRNGDPRNEDEIRRQLDRLNREYQALSRPLIEALVKINAMKLPSVLLGVDIAKDGAETTVYGHVERGIVYIDRLVETPAPLAPRTRLDVVATSGCKASTEVQAPNEQLEIDRRDLDKL